jgi:hypothetical protein
VSLLLIFRKDDNVFVLLKFTFALRRHANVVDSNTTVAGIHPCVREGRRPAAHN